MNAPDGSGAPPASVTRPEKGHALRYETSVDLTEENTSQTKIVLLTGKDKKVLEIGPATGDTSKVLRDRGCRVTGIEIDPVAAEISAQFCERMIVGNVEELDLESLLEGEKFDVVLFSDVLEHLVNPGRILTAVASLLAPGGYVCASIPNIAHGSVRLLLFGGQFRYLEKGLLDRTHLRFFTKDGVEELFASAGFEIQEWQRTEVDIFTTELELKEEDYPRTLVDAVRAGPEYSTYQFVVKAEPVSDDVLIKANLPAQVNGARPLGMAMRPLWDLEMKAWELQQEVHRLNGRVQVELHNVAALESRLAGVQHAHELVVNRTNYKMWQKLVQILDKWAPWGTRRRRVILLPGYAARILLEKGPGGLALHLLKFWKWAPKIFKKAMHESAADPKDKYRVWEELYVLSPELVKAMRKKQRKFTYQPAISIVMPVYNPEPEWVRSAIESVKGQIYPNWELCIADDGSTREDVLEVLRSYASSDSRIKVRFLERNVGIGAASAAALELATGEFVGLLDHDDELKPHALYQVVKLLNERSDLDYIYSDLDHKDMDGVLKDPFRKPDWSPDLLKSCNYVTHFSVYRKSVIERVGGFRQGYDGSQDWDLTLRVTESTDRIGHIRTPLYTWRQVPGSAAHSDDTKPWAHDAARRAIADSLARQGIKGTVEDGPYLGYYRVRYEIIGNPKVSIIIPTRDRLDLLSRCIDSIHNLSTYKNYEIVVVDNNSVEEETLSYLRTFGGRVVKHAGEFNFSKIVNIGAAHVDAEYLLLLNNDTEVITPGWIEAMLEHAQRPEVGAVGARLLFPDGKAQHEGVIVGPGDGLAGNVDFENYFGLGRCIHNASAVTAACMMTRSEIFKGLGGFEEELKVGYNDVDYCLRAGEKGFLIVYTPYATLKHDEAATRGYGNEETANKSHPVADEEFFRSRWFGYSDPFDPPSLKIDLPLIPSI
jgi:glycosyltransferase involved in cell wall biosynthesis/2-polyprenyl-3-methyl-5-hydroxy-6-metoxy-1,4-benzoquinol methylase